MFNACLRTCVKLNRTWFVYITSVIYKIFILSTNNKLTAYNITGVGLYK